MKIIIILTICLLSLTGCNNNSKNNSNTTNIERLSIPTPVEEQIATATTKVYIDEQNRNTNILLTCSKITNIIVQPSETFSFCDTVGPATEEKRI